MVAFENKARFSLRVVWDVYSLKLYLVERVSDALFLCHEFSQLLFSLNIVSKLAKLVQLLSVFFRTHPLKVVLAENLN